MDQTVDLGGVAGTDDRTGDFGAAENPRQGDLGRRASVTCSDRLQPVREGKILRQLGFLK